MEVTRELTNLETALASLLVVAKVCCNAQVPQVHTTIVVGLELYEEGSDIPVQTGYTQGTRRVHAGYPRGTRRVHARYMHAGMSDPSS